MKQRGLLILVVLLVLSADRPKVDSPKQAAVHDEMQALQGIWVLQTVEYLGEKGDQEAILSEVDLISAYRSALPEERELKPDVRKDRTTLTIKGSRFVFRQSIGIFNSSRSPRGVCREGSFEIDVLKEPKIMKRSVDTSYEEATPFIRDPDRGTYYWIYSVEGDTLQCCARAGGTLNNLPSKFATDTEEDVVLLTFKRERN